MNENQQLICSRYWIQDYGIKACQLTHTQILNKMGFKAVPEFVDSVKKNVKPKYNQDLYSNIVVKDGSKYYLTGGVKCLLDEEAALQTLIRKIQGRITWLKSGSRSELGVITEKNVLFIMDSYERGNASFSNFCNSIAGIIREQVVEIDSFNIVRLGDTRVHCFQEMKHVSKESLRQALAFVLSQQPPAKLMREMMDLQIRDVDSIYLLVQGSETADPSPDYYDTLNDHNIPINTCIYGYTAKNYSNILTELAANSGGKWHKFPKAECEEDNEELNLLVDELNRARDILAEITALRLEIEHKTGSSKALICQVPKCKAEYEMSSEEWLQLHGLKKNALRFFDALAQQSFSHCNKIMSGTDGLKVVDAKYCHKFAHITWWNGETKHVMINKNFFEKYKSNVEDVISKIESRIVSMKDSSKVDFGILREDNVCILLDMSCSMEPHLPYLKERLKKLIEEQLPMKTRFNFIAFGGNVQLFNKTLERVTPETLQAAGLWCNSLKCSGTTNILDALELASDLDGVQGIYLLSDGSSDHPEHHVIERMKCFSQIPIHTISFNCQDRASNGFLASIANKSGGKHHSVSAKEITLPEIQLLIKELETGNSDINRMADLLKKCEELEAKSNKKVVKQKKVKRVQSPRNNGSFNAARWLKKHGLAAHKLTIMDALAPTVITQSSGYVDILKKKVHSKVYEGVMPFAFIDSNNPDSVSLVNPAAIDLVTYENNVSERIAAIDRKTSEIVWEKLSDEEKAKFDESTDDEGNIKFDESSDAPPSYQDHSVEFRKALENSNWPVSKKTINLMCKEIEVGKLYITQSEQLRSRQDKMKDDTKELIVAKADEAKGADKLKKNAGPSSNFMLGYRVIAQNSVDGFYYLGTVIKNTRKNHLEIEFDDFDRQSVPHTSVLPVNGSTSRPPLKEGDYVLVLLHVNKEGASRKVLAPGLVVAPPFNGPSFSILLFTGEKLLACRRDLFKITRSRYMKTSNDIYDLLSRRRSAQCLRLVAEGGVDMEGSIPGSLDEILRSNLVLNKPMSINDDGSIDEMMQSPRSNIDNLSEKELDLAEQSGDQKDDLKNDAEEDMDGNLNEDLEQQTYGPVIKVTLECGSQVGGQDAHAQTQISSDFWDDLEEVKYSQEELMVFKQKDMDSNLPPCLPLIDIPELKVSASTQIQTDLLSVDGKEDTSVIFDGNIESSSDESSDDSSDTSIESIKKRPGKVEVEHEGPRDGEVILARWSDDGWYFRGKVAGKQLDKYIVEDNWGQKEEISRNHILCNEKDNNEIIHPGSHVIGLHPDYSFSYAPARVVSCSNTWFYTVMFYDETEAEVPREELFLISEKQYHEDIQFIRDIESSLLGSFVVVRDDADGYFRKAMVTQATGRAFGISLHEKTMVQDPHLVLPQAKGNEKIDVGCYCLCPLTDLNDCFVPGIVVDTDKELTARLYSGDSLVCKGPCYPISKDFYAAAVNFILSKDSQSKEI